MVLMQLNYVKDNIVDVVLMDESMPGITGLANIAANKRSEQQSARCADHKK